MNIQTVKLDDLVTEGLQVRCSTNKDVAAEYAEAIKDGAKFPPVIVYRQSVGSAKAPSGKYLLADGRHSAACETVPKVDAQTFPYSARTLGIMLIKY